MPFILQRIYQENQQAEGRRILIDRVWPRGISKEKANLDCWMKEIAPSPDLRKWFGHDPKNSNRLKKPIKMKSNNTLKNREASRN